MIDTASGSVNTFLISIAKMPYDPSRRDYKSFDSILVNDQTICDVVTTKVWSPINYSSTHRAKANFKQSQIIGIDCDDGTPSMAEISDQIRDWGAWAIIGTTPSHMKEKRTEKEVKPPCERFRIIFKMSSVISDLEQYEYNFARWVKALRGDIVVKDGARYYKPCTEIIFKHYGEPMDFLELPTDYIRKAEREKQSEIQTRRHRDEETIPLWVLRWVNDGPPQGKGRHHASYVIGWELGRLGYTQDEIVDYLMSSAVISQIGRVDVDYCAGCGRKKGLGENFDQIRESGQENRIE